MSSEIVEPSPGTPRPDDRSDDSPAAARAPPGESPPDAAPRPARRRAVPADRDRQRR